MIASSEFLEELSMDNDLYAAKWVSRLLRKHPETYRHCIRVAMLAEKMANPLSLDRAVKDDLIRGCFMHDIGKTMIPRKILDQPLPLTKEQWDIIKLHPVVGAEVVETNPGFSPEIIAVVRYHHERWDGTGYPDGLKGSSIPMAARICSVIDAFDSMISGRTYRKRTFTLNEAKIELLQHSGTQFDPDIVKAFMELSDEALKSIYSWM